MTGWRYLFGIGMFLGMMSAGWACQPLPPMIQRMAEHQLTVPVMGGGERELPVRVADEPIERAAGFQHVCPEAYQDLNILFVFERPYRPMFHMRNVLAPLDIVFMDEAGSVIDLMTMEPEGNGYQPSRNAKYALEMRAGLAKEMGLLPGAVIVNTP